MSHITATAVTQEGLTHIARNLRERDRAEIFALRWTDDEADLVRDIAAVAGDLWRMWFVDQEPVAVAGVCPMRPGVAIAGAFGTDRWHRVVRSITKFGVGFIVPVLRSNKYHRLETYILAENTDSRAWVELMGGKLEAVLHGYGRGREDFLLYVNDLSQSREVQNVLWRGQQGREYRPGNGSPHCH